MKQALVGARIMVDVGAPPDRVRQQYSLSPRQMAGLLASMPRSDASPADLARWRQELGFSQQDLAVELGVGLMTVSRWERGLTRPPAWAVGRILAMRGVQNESDEMEIGSVVRVVRSPYFQGKRSDVGYVVARIRQKTPREILVVQFKDGKTWEFYPSELAVLGEQNVPAEGRQEEEE